MFIIALVQNYSNSNFQLMFFFLRLKELSKPNSGEAEVM